MINDIRFYNANPRLKRAGEQIAFTPEQVQEYIKCRDNKIYFAENYVKIVHVDKGLINIPLYEYQKKMINVLTDHRFVIALQARQSGKTTTITIDMLHYILFNSHKTCAILANKGATAREILSRIKLAYENLPLWLQQGVVEWNKGSIELENGSRIITAGTSEDSIRGQSISYLLVDEAAFLSIWDEFYKSTYPTIASGSSTRIVLVSTANGMNHYYKLWTDAVAGKNMYYPFEVTWKDVPGRDEKWKEETIRNTSLEAFMQEHENIFMGSSDTLIPSSKLREIPLSDPQEVYFGGKLKVYQPPADDRIYCMVVDTSHGKGLDYSAFTVFDITEFPIRQVATFYDSNVSPLVYPSIISEVGSKYNSAYVLCESNDLGGQVVSTLNYDLEYENLLSLDEKTKNRYQLGVRTTKKVKSIGCSTLHDLIMNDKLLVCDEKTVYELSGFKQKGMSYQADTGYHDDLVMTLVLFAYLTTTPLFNEIQSSNENVRKAIHQQTIEEMMDDLAPFGIIVDGTESVDKPTQEIEPDGTVWTHV